MEKKKKPKPSPMREKLKEGFKDFVQLGQLLFCVLTINLFQCNT